MNRIELEDELVYEIHQLPLSVLEEVQSLIEHLKTERLLLAGVESGKSTPLDMSVLRVKARAMLDSESR